MPVSGETAIVIGLNPTVLGFVWNETAAYAKGATMRMRPPSLRLGCVRMDTAQAQRSVMARPHMSRISQETLTTIGATIALAAVILTSTAGVRDDLRAEIRDVRAEARADREAMRAEHETFRNQILRLTEQQGVLSARLDRIRDPSATNR